MGIAQYQGMSIPDQIQRALEYDLGLLESIKYQDQVTYNMIVNNISNYTSIIQPASIIYNDILSKKTTLVIKKYLCNPVFIIPEREVVIVWV